MIELNISASPPIFVAARSKVSFCDCSIAGIAGSNPTEGLYSRFLSLLRIVQLETAATGRSLVQRSTAECVCFIQCDQVLQ